jgi:hypothetical protein
MGTLTKPPANILELPLAQRAEMALRVAVEKVVEEHVRDGGRSTSGATAKWLKCRPKNSADNPHGRNRSCATCSQSISISALRLRRAELEALPR